MKNERIPLYQQIQDYIRALIHNSELKQGDRIPTEKELMEQFQVSKITVVNALTGLVNEGLISRVPGRGSFVNAVSHGDEPMKTDLPDQEDKTSAYPSQEKRLVGIVMPTVEDYFSIRLLEGMKNRLFDSGYTPIILLSGGRLEWEQDAIRLCLNMNVEGLLIFPVDEDTYNEDILSMKLQGFPFVLIDRYLPGVETDYIASDGKYGVSLAVDYLWELGYRNIAICSDSPTQTVSVQERIEGYMDALRDKGALINPAHIITEFSMDLPEEEMQNHPLFRYIKNKIANAYITLNGKLGARIMQMAEKANLQVPQDLSIITFDDPTSFMEGYHTFTHIRQSEREIGARAAQLLVERMNASDQENYKYSQELIKPQLVIGQTTGPNRQG